MPKYVKKFMNVLPETDAWIRQASAESGIKQVDVIRGSLEMCSLMPPDEFYSKLRTARLEAKDRALQAQLEALQRARAELQEELSRPGKAGTARVSVAPSRAVK